MAEDSKIKHLEFIQLIISRLAGNSFLIKSWTITLSLAAIGFYLEKRTSNKLLLAVTLGVLIFWILDGFLITSEVEL